MDFSKLIEFITTDKSRYGYRNFLKCFFLVPGFRFTVYLRITRYLEFKNKFLYFFAKIYLRQMSYKYGIDMYSSTTIGKGFYIGHFGGIVVNGGVIFGDNVNISQGVTIGQINEGRLKGNPMIGNNVWVGANAVVVGGIKIGNNVSIAPCSFVNFDVPDYSLVMGSPGVIVKENYKKPISDQ
jgi:serine O-acetyltransferase